MQTRKRHWLKLAFITGFLSIGIPYWSIPYNRVNLPDGVYGPGLVMICIFALLLRTFGIASFVRVLNVLAATVPAVVMLRVLVEGIMDPTRHNLWPLELIIALAVGYCVVAVGATVGHVIFRVRRGR